MKKLLLVILFVLIFVCSLSAKSYKLSFSDIDKHPEILGGFFPTSAVVNFSYNGFKVMPQNLTQLRFSFGGGYRQRQIFQNPETGEQIDGEMQGEVFDEFNVIWGLRFAQGLGKSWVEGLDKFTLYLGYEGRFENYFDSCLLLPGGGGWKKKVGKTLDLGLPEQVAPQTLETWLINREAQTVYPELQKETNITSLFYTGASFNYLKDTKVTKDGLNAELKLMYAPKVLSRRTHFYGIELNAVAGATLLEFHRPKNLSTFTICILDRLNVSYLGGDAVAIFASHNHSLGRKMRGFDNNSYNKEFVVVNNFDVRFAGPEVFMKGLFPRMNIFVDCGLYAGKYINAPSSEKSKGFLASIGAQVEFSIMEAIDLGLQFAYRVKGTNVRTPDSKTSFGAIFQLDF